MAAQAYALASQVVGEYDALSAMPAIIDAFNGDSCRNGSNLEQHEQHAPFQLADWIWAQAVVRSRAFPAHDGVNVALWPGIDHGNHSCSAAFGSYCNSETGCSGLVAGPNMLPPPPHSSGSSNGEIFYNYGKYLSNEQLLLYYGFADANHTNDWSVCTFGDAHCKLLAGPPSAAPGPVSKPDDAFWSCFEDVPEPEFDNQFDLDGIPKRFLMYGTRAMHSRMLTEPSEPNVLQSGIPAVCACQN